MRVALDATYSVDSEPSGIAVYSRELLSGLAQAYPKTEFLHCYRLKQFRRAPRPRFPNTSRRLLIPPLATFHSDLFHALNQRVDKRPAKRVISTFHDLFVMTGEYSSPEFRERFTQQAQRAARNSDFIIAVSRFTANQVSTLLGFDQSRIRVVPHGVRMPATVEQSGRENMILFVGALQKRKNVARLVEAFETLPADWTLVLAGALSGYEASSILDRIERSACRSRIQVTGYVEAAQLKQLYRRASIFAFPSLDEGFGIPVLEAMAHGVPVVTSIRSALVELARHTAWLVNPESTEDLAAGLRRLIQDAELRTMLGRLGRTRAKAYSWERAVRRTYEVYEEALK